MYQHSHHAESHNNQQHYFHIGIQTCTNISTEDIAKPQSWRMLLLLLLLLMLLSLTLTRAAVV